MGEFFGYKLENKRVEVQGVKTRLYTLITPDTINK